MNNFNNKFFWNNRYKTDPTLGSGRGSRGHNLKMKEDIVNNILNTYNIDSVLDIGCGDCEVNKNIEFKNYTGVDVSDFIIEKNSKLYPNRNFILGDFGKIKESNLTQYKYIVVMPEPTYLEKSVWWRENGFGSRSVFGITSSSFILVDIKVWRW